MKAFPLPGGFLNGMAFLDVPEIRPPTLCYSLNALDPTVLIHLASCYCEQQSKGCKKKPSRLFLGPSFCPIERMIPGHRLWS
uniref:Uncharacterized protein n=1 Tax=Utricularia reniformis TaxID=192314 RepID=A0A1Y0B2E3_9LAMI|nr:hypothetical protein AEK19_MT1363 [Utricularia reniformis]ART31561.1 hypothetical protein AEK19_MT1363 [Utricularia reniformis]